MIPDAVVQHADIGRKILRTGRAVRIEEKQRFARSLESAASESPVGNLIMLIGRHHIVDILRIVSAVYSLSHANKLLGLSKSTTLKLI